MLTSPMAIPHSSMSAAPLKPGANLLEHEREALPFSCAVAATRIPGMTPGRKLLISKRIDPGAGFCRGAPPSLYRSLGMSEKKFPQISAIFGICLARMELRCSGRCLLPMRQTALPGQHAQYRLQIAERRGKIVGELSIPGSILTTIAQMADSETAMNLLRQVPLFANLKDEDQVCIEETEEWRFPAGEMLFRGRDAPEYFFVFLEGEISCLEKTRRSIDRCRSLQIRCVLRRGPASTGTPCFRWDAWSPIAG